MPVVSRNFSSHMVASLSKSVECGSLSLCWGEEGRASSATVCILAEHGGLEHYRMSDVVLLFGPRASSHSVADLIRFTYTQTYDLCFPSRR